MILMISKQKKKGDKKIIIQNSGPDASKSTVLFTENMFNKL